jgi:phosphoribosylglycinamide formyltransferase-1
MRIVKEPLLKAFERRIINIHPSLLPKFPGLEAWKQALEAGEKITGCTVHYVNSGIDTGSILGQRSVPVLPTDTPEQLHHRIQEAEHELLPDVIRELGAVPEI